MRPGQAILPILLAGLVISAGKAATRPVLAGGYVCTTSDAPTQCRVDEAICSLATFGFCSLLLSERGWTYSPSSNLFGIASDCRFAAGDNSEPAEVRIAGTTRSYKFGVYCGPDGDELLAKTSASYDTQTSIATENDVQVLESNKRIGTSYTCSSDPWVATNQPAPTCSRTGDSLGSRACGGNAIGASGFVCDDPLDLPYSVAVLGDTARGILQGALTQIQQQNASAPSSSDPVPSFGAAPSPTPNPLIVFGAHLPGDGPVPFSPAGAPANLRCLLASGCSQTLAVVTSPSPNQAVQGDVTLNVVRASQNADDGVFQVEWDYQTNNGAWAVADTGQVPNQLPATVDKTQNPSGLTVPRILFTAQCSASNMTTCQWRVRAQLSNPSGSPWSNYVRFTVQ